MKNIESFKKRGIEKHIIDDNYTTYDYRRNHTRNFNIYAMISRNSIIK